MAISKAAATLFAIYHTTRITHAQTPNQRRILQPTSNSSSSDAENRGPVKIGDNHKILISSDATASDIAPVASSDGTTFRYELHHDDASYLAVHFRALDLPEDCRITLSESDGTGGASYDDDAIVLRKKGFHDLETFWARHVRGDAMDIALTCDGVRVEESGARFAIDEYVSGYPESRMAAAVAGRDLRAAFDGSMSTPRIRNGGVFPERRRLGICKLDDKKNAVCYEETNPTHYLRSRAVARLLVNGSTTCTGWLVMHTPSLLMTNEHCIARQSDVDNTDFEFMGEEPTCDTTSGNCRLCDRGRIFDGAKLLKVNKKKDYALVELEGNPALEYGYLHLDNRRPRMGEEIYIPQHPNGRAKEIAIRDDNERGRKCRVMNMQTNCYGSSNDEDVAYSCDTEGGTSGAPVISKRSQKVIALHHCGGGCGGNLGVPVTSFYDEISRFLTYGSQIPPTAAPSMSPTRGCPSDEMLFRLRITPDNYPNENRWDLVFDEGSSNVGTVHLSAQLDQPDHESTNATSAQQESSVVIDQSEFESDERVKQPSKKKKVQFTSERIESSLTDIQECIPKDCYVFTMYDKYEDGMCCSYGHGEFSVHVESDLVVQGSEFGAKIWQSFGTCQKSNESPPTATEVISVNDMERWGVFKRGGRFSGRRKVSFAHSQELVGIVRYNKNMESSIYTDSFDVKKYRALLVDFWFLTWRFTDTDEFFLEYSLDEGKNWVVAGMKVKADGFKDHKWYNQVFDIVTEDIDSIAIRFRCNANHRSRQVLLDDVTFAGVLTASWKVIAYEGFDSPARFGIFKSGGTFAKLHQGRLKRSGTRSVILRDNRDELSSVYTDPPLVVTSYTKLKVEFWSNSMRFNLRDKFALEYSNIKRPNYWIRVRDWSLNDFSDRKWYQGVAEIDVDKIDKIAIRFRCQSRTPEQIVVLDNIQISGISE